MKISLAPLTPLTKKIGLTLAVILFIFAAGLFYVNKILLPIQVKGFAIKAAQDALKRSVDFDTLQYSPLRGFIITDLVIAEKDDPKAIFLKAKSISAQVLFFALLQKKVIIPSLNINGPQVTLTRTAKDTWNLSDLLTPAVPGTAAEKPAMDIVISGFSITNARINLADTSLTDTFNETIEIPTIKGSLSFSSAFHVAGEIVLPSTNGSLKFDTRTGLRDQSFKGTFKIKNVSVDRYLRFTPAELPVNIHKLIVAESEIIAITQGKNINVSGNISVPTLIINTPDGTTLAGSIALTKAIADVNEKAASLQGTLLANAVTVTTSTGLKAAVSTLRAADILASIKEDKITISTDIDAKDANIALSAQQKINGNINLRRVSVTMNGTSLQASADVDIKDISVEIPDTSVTADINAPGTKLSFDTGKLDITLEGAFKKLSIKAKDITASGTPGVSARVSFDPQATMPLSYSGAIDIPGFLITGLPTVGEIKDIRGAITFNTDRATLKDVTFTVLETPVHVTGDMTNFSSPKLDITAKADTVNLGIIQKIIPEIIKEQGLDIKGTASAEIHFSGAAADPQKAMIAATTKLTDVSVESRKLKQSASAINGLITYNAPTLSWKDLSLNFQGKAWMSNGSLEDFVNPVINASVKADDLSAEIKAKKEGDSLTIQSLTGSYFDSNMNLTGKVLIPAGQTPSIDMTGECKLSLRDLPRMLPPEQAKQIEALKLAGILKIKAGVKGVPQDWQELTSTISVTTPAIYMMGYQMADLEINAEQKDGTLDPFSITGKLYGGDLDTAMTVKLKEKNMPFELTSRLDNTSLELLKKDTPLKNQQMAGFLGATAELKGTLLDIRNTTGSAAVKVTNGYLWDLEIISKVLSILSSSFQGGDVIITDASATFKIADQKVMTTDLALKSATVTLSGEGWVDFDQNVELNISPALQPKTSSDGTVNPLEAFNPTAGIINIRVYGKLTAPKFEHNVTAPQILKKTFQNTVGTLFKLFE